MTKGKFFTKVIYKSEFVCLEEESILFITVAISKLGLQIDSLKIL